MIQLSIDDELWRELFDAEVSLLKARQKFLTQAQDKSSVFKKSLKDPLYRGLALRILRTLDIKYTQDLFVDLLGLASVGQSDISLVRETILSLPKEWILNHIEQVAANILSNGTYEEYRRLLELYIEIDNDLTKRLAQQASAHIDDDIREAGEDFLSMLAQIR